MKKMMNLKQGIAVLLTAVIAVSGFAISNVYDRDTVVGGGVIA